LLNYLFSIEFMLRHNDYLDLRVVINVIKQGYTLLISNIKLSWI